MLLGTQSKGPVEKSITNQVEPWGVRGPAQGQQGHPNLVTLSLRTWHWRGWRVPVPSRIMFCRYPIQQISTRPIPNIFRPFYLGVKHLRLRAWSCDKKSAWFLGDQFSRPGSVNKMFRVSVTLVRDNRFDHPPPSSPAEQTPLLFKKSQHTVCSEWNALHNYQRKKSQCSRWIFRPCCW